MVSYTGGYMVRTGRLDWHSHTGWFMGSYPGWLDGSYRAGWPGSYAGRLHGFVRALLAGLDQPWWDGSVITIRVVATDLDGTLLRSDSALSDRTQEALRLTRAAGVRVVAATARPARFVEELFGSGSSSGSATVTASSSGSATATGSSFGSATATGSDHGSEALIDTAICGNGAVRYDVGSHQVLITHPLPQDVTWQVMAEVSRLVPDAGFAVETGHRVLFEPRYRYRPTLDHDRVPVGTLAELVATPLVKLMVWLPDHDPDAAWARLRPSLGRLVECTWSAERAPLEIAAPGVSKAAALARLCQDWQVEPAEVIAFGDAPNDLPMLAWAGTAYAVANAHSGVLAAAPYHTAANDEDGVAQILEKLFR